MKNTNIRVQVNDGHEYATVHYFDPCTEHSSTEISVSNGGNFMISAKCTELLYDALHEIFGKN